MTDTKDPSSRDAHARDAVTPTPADDDGGERDQRPRLAVSLPTPTPRPGLRARVKDIVRDAEQRTGRRRRERAGLYALRLGLQVVRQWAHDRCPQQAAALAFQTVLSIVPLLAVGLVFLRATGNTSAESSFVNFLSREFVRVDRGLIAEKLQSWSENVTFESLGLIGLISTILLAFITASSTEKVINDIWRSERRRTMTQKFVVFYATITLGPFFIGTSLYQATQYGLTEGGLGLVISFATSFGALFLANYFLPVLPVRPRAAAVGALVSTILFELAKFGFDIYINEFAFAKFTGIYGTVAMVPIWLVWIYYAWLTFLLGIEVAHAVQNIGLLQRTNRRQPLSLENELIQRVNGVVAARVMCAICASYIAGDKATSRRALEDRFDLSSEVLERLVERLKTRDLLIETEGEPPGLVPARPPSEIRLTEVLAVFRGGDVTIGADDSDSQLDRILSALSDDAEQHTRITLDRLV